MKQPTSRRRFMRNSALAMTGLAIVSPSITSAMNFAHCPFSGYNPYAENTHDLRHGLLGGNTVSVQGTIFKNDGVTPVSNAMLEVWHLSPNSKKYRHRGKLQTDEHGSYRFLTDFPNKEAGRQARIYFKVSTADKMEFTELLLSQNGPLITSTHWEKNQTLGDRLFPKQQPGVGRAEIHFNFSI